MRTRDEAQRRLDSMNAHLIHRGPDDADSTLTGRAGLAMRRLAIVGIDSGQQPIDSEDGRLAIVGNGEIYNAPELRRQLELDGHRFRGGSDIEVVLHLFEEHGEDAFAHLNGMFGLAILDRDRERVLLVRDRLGIKPLFYVTTPHGSGFASELPALAAGFADDDTSFDLEPSALIDYLRHGYVVSPTSIYRGVRRVPAGHSLWIDSETATEPRAWWTMPEFDPENRSTESFADEAGALLEDSVRLRTLGDVPAGAFLSGGLDSGTIVALLSQSVEHRIPTFTIAFDDAEYDETEDARRTADAFGCVHHVERMTDVDADELDNLFSTFGEPFADVSLLPTHRVARLAARHVKYVLSGDGGDELFAGYAWLTREARLRRLPRAVLGTARLLSPLLERGQRSTRADVWGRAFRALGDLSAPIDRSFLRRRSLTSASALGDLLVDTLADEASRPTRLESFAAGATPPDLSTMLDLDRRFYLPGDILEKVDRATMRHSLEARVPFLDHRMVELAAKIPISTQLGPKGGGKAVLRKVIERVLPAPLLQRRKRGFGIPVDRLLAGPLHQPLRERLLDRSFLSNGWVREAAVEELLDAHRTGRCRHGHLLWALWSLATWSQSRTKSAAGTPTLAGV